MVWLSFWGVVGMVWRCSLYFRIFEYLGNISGILWVGVGAGGDGERCPQMNADFR
jgi:hypothetical protein